MTSDSAPWSCGPIAPEPPAHVLRVRVHGAGSVALGDGDEASRGGPCDCCAGSLWAWTLLQQRGGEQDPRGDAWVCWLDLDFPGSLTQVVSPAG